MGGESPVVELYDSNGNPLAVQNGSAIPASTPAIIVAGSDGANSRYILVDSSGNQVMVGAGTAGTPSGGVVSIQGVSGGQTVPVSGTISASQTGNIDAGNSSTTPLAGSGTFSGTGIDVSVYGVITVFVFADQAGTLNIEFSTNNTNWDDVNSYPISASTAFSVQFGPQAKFFRVVYQNGSSAQSVFRLQTIEKPITSFPETVPASYVINANDDMILTKSVITGKTTGGGGGYVDVKVNPSGTLTVDASGSSGLTGTFTANQGTSPWVTNITQFGGNNIVTGTGAGGVGIPRVTVSNDSNILATQSGSWIVTSNQGTSPWVTNITQFGSNNVVTGTGTSGVGIPRVTVSNDSNILATQSGTWTVAQGAPNTLANKWPVQVTDGTNTMPTGDAVGRAIFHKITDGTNTAGVDANNHIFVAGKSAVGATPTGNPVAVSGVDNGGLKRALLTDTGGRQFALITDATNTAAVKAASVAPAATDPALVVALGPNTNLFSFGGDQRLRVGQETLLFFDNVDGTTVDTNKWTQSQSGMTQSQTGGNLTLNAGSSTTSGNYSILTSNKQMLILDEFPLYVQFRARMVQQTNAVIELGFGNAATTATPTDGVFFRIDSSGNLKGVLNFNGSETTTATLTTLTATTFYNFEVTIYEDHASFEVQSSDGATNIDVDLAIPLTNGSPTSIGHLPVYARVYNSSATSAAAQIVLASVNVQQMDLNMNKPWAEQVAGAGRASSIDPSTLAQSANYTNNTAPASATLSNTAAGYTTLGGLFQFAAVAGAETDYALFAYQVPTGFQLYVWTITITAFITGAQSSTNPTLLQWAVAANSSAVSLATGAPNPPIRTPIGMQQANKTANIGDPFNPGTLTYAPRTPIVVNSGKYLHIILRIPIANATTNQIIRGSCTVEGYFE